jgi:hypothetical protein
VFVSRFHPLFPAGCLAASLFPATLLAQTPTDEAAAQARFHLGPLALTPTFAVRDIGMDTNVFNEASNPTQDFTASLVPGADAWLRIGRATLVSSTDIEWVYFKDASTERSFNLGEEARVEFDLARLRPFAGGLYIRTRKRPNPEIDARVLQLTRGGYGGVQVLVGARLLVDVEARLEQIEVGEDETGETALAFGLNRESQAGSATVRWTLTPLTTFVVRTEVETQRFEFDTTKDNDGVLVMPGLEFKPLALIQGKAFAGVRALDGRDSTLPDFTGVVADVALGWTISDLTQFAATVQRDVHYSFEPFHPYFVLTGVHLEAAQMVGYSWDVVGRVGRSRLAYEDLLGPATLDEPKRVDRVVSFGGGVGRHLGERVRVGLNVDYGERRSSIASRNYDGVRVGGTLTYGY